VEDATNWAVTGLAVATTLPLTAWLAYRVTVWAIVRLIGTGDD
jgi:hypothetical protein